jgi:hypothetical protein
MLLQCLKSSLIDRLCGIGILKYIANILCWHRGAGHRGRGRRNVPVVFILGQLGPNRFILSEVFFPPKTDKWGLVRTGWACTVCL